MTSQNFIYILILIDGSGAPQIQRRRVERTMKTIGKSENRYTRTATRVYDFSERIDGTE